MLISIDSTSASGQLKLFFLCFDALFDEPVSNVSVLKGNNE